MWRVKWLRWLSKLKLWKLLTLVMLMLLSTAIFTSRVAEAASSADVTVTAVGYVCGAPGGLTLTYISDYEVGISWVKGAGAENTMIRAAIGRYPQNINDGWQVYYGEGTSATGWTNMEALSEPVYYRAWSQSAGGIWNEVGYTEDKVEGIGMQLLAFVILAVGLTIGGYALKNMALSYGAGGAWVVLAFYSMSKSASPNVTEITDIYMALFWIGLGMVLVCMLEPVIYRKAKALAEEVAELSDSESLQKDFDNLHKEMSSIRLRPRGNRKPKRKMSKFEKTGEIE